MIAQKFRRGQNFRLTPVSEIFEKSDRIRCHFSFSSAAGDCMVICEEKPLAILHCLDCSRSLNRSRILKFEKCWDPDLKILEQEWSPSQKK